jgi:small subunit ribosomal protein S15
MTITKDRKHTLIGEYRRTESDSGSPEVQIALCTERINNLTAHMRTHEKDYASRRGLLMLVSRRRSLLDYLRKVNPNSYLELIGRLGIRK